MEILVEKHEDTTNYYRIAYEVLFVVRPVTGKLTSCYRCFLIRTNSPFTPSTSTYKFDDDYSDANDKSSTLRRWAPAPPC